MNKLKFLSFFLIGTIFCVAFYSPKITLHKLEYPDYFPKPFYSFENNPLSKEGIILGRRLFYDPILSKDSSISCSSCHLSFTAFTHVDHKLSHGINDSIGTRNSPTLINLAWSNHFMWDGAINHLDFQALAPITHPAEMGEEINHVIQKLNKTNYPSLFYKAFQDSMITGEYLLKAIAQFELTLISCNSKYDSVIQNKTTFTVQEERGYQLFKQNCSSCHTEPLFTNNNFEKNDLPIDTILNDLGRFSITQLPSDSLKFKTPTLRNIEFSYPYMHDGRFKSISEVLDHYNQNYSNKIHLNEKEKVDLTVFLLTLSDKNFLFNKDFSFPRNLFFNKKKDTE